MGGLPFAIGRNLLRWAKKCWKPPAAALNFFKASLSKNTAKPQVTYIQAFITNINTQRHNTQLLASKHNMMDTSSAHSNALAPSNPASNRRPRAQSMQHFSDKCSIPRDCCTSGSFVSKLFRMVDTEPSTIVSWCRGGSAFCIVDPKMMAEHCLPKYFRHRRFSSLIRQLNFYSFYRVQEGQLTIYQQSYFRKDRPDLLVHIKRRGAGKAKDPWFDPIANSSNKAPESNIVVAPMSGVQTPRMTPTPLSLLAACYSPMAKSAVLDNMSPALKPILTQTCPPSVDLNGSCLSESMSKKDLDVVFPFSSTINMKNDLLGDLIDTSLSKAPSTLSAPLDIDIQDFLTDDCNISSGQIDDRLCNVVNQNKCAMVSRDCLKVDDSQNVVSSPLLSSQDLTNSGSFDNEVLMGLANVEPGAWEVPLSPLNDEEDVVPWLDLCF
ncbi:heat shock transcription factor [Plasmopara halstedii]|uniref:Heat shock transcription factor n=1 Tax=Plasmopara halstedii TaxID=4781 RepID=A0A0P1AWW2_PLAHL|nr:heat shock transcription factor [Plasmopara halstedii]CEG45199.1 heat shock transcription factor [Plasmopara halstedii]|eukprot:XP_024581568.1 heat shock transcription factor [Plasmopara halstedii]